MNIQTAADILQIEVIHIVDTNYIKKQYHRLALQYHPDKNNSKESHLRFQQINEAYNYLKDMNKKYNREEIPTSEDDYDTSTYTGMLGIFIKNILAGSYKEAIYIVVKDIVSSNNVSNTIFESLDKPTSIEIYELLCKYKTILHIDSTLIENVKNIILTKYSNDQIYILNPCLDDLFDNNVYKFELTNKTYLVPLWHNELYFDGVNNSEVIVKCIPELPENVSIDENNNLLVYLSVKLEKGLLTNNIAFQLGSKTFYIQTSNLYLKTHQSVVLKKQGISKIMEHDMYNIDNKSDIFVSLTLV
jgi:hypothetical protein